MRTQNFKAKPKNETCHSQGSDKGAAAMCKAITLSANSAEEQNSLQKESHWAMEALPHAKWRN